MNWTKTDKPKERFYLFAGMGGKASRRKNRVFLAWAVAAGLIVSAALAVAFFFVNHLNGL